MKGNVEVQAVEGRRLGSAGVGYDGVGTVERTDEHGFEVAEYLGQRVKK